MVKLNDSLPDEVGAMTPRRRPAAPNTFILLLALCLLAVAHAQTEEQPSSPAVELAQRLSVDRDSVRHAVDRARRVVSLFAERDLGKGLVYEGYTWSKPFDLTWRLRVPDTDELFEVRERDGQVVRWDMGSYHPQLGAEATDMEAYERDFIGRYYRHVPGEAMTLALEATSPEARTALYYQRPSDTALAVMNFCKFVWVDGRTRLQKVLMGHEGLDISPHATLSQAQALMRAEAFAEQLPGVASATAVPVPSNLKADCRDLARLWQDDAGLQRLEYTFDIQSSSAEGVAPPPSDGVVVERRSVDQVAVDAQTGACFSVLAPVVWPKQAVGARLLPIITVPGVFSVGKPSLLFFLPRLVEGHVYVCGRYFSSLIWSGKYERDGRLFAIEYAGRELTGSTESGALRLGGVDVTSSLPPLVIEEEIYVPADMVERITGWSVGPPGQLGEATTVCFAPPAARR